MPEIAQIFTGKSCMSIGKLLFDSNYWDHIQAMFGPYFGHVWVISRKSLLVDAGNVSHFH